MEEKLVEYEIAIKPFKTEEEAKRCMVNIYEELRMDESIFRVKPILGSEEIEFMIDDLKLKIQDCNIDKDRDFYSKIIAKLICGDD
jgi:hypothetical protein